VYRQWADVLPPDIEVGAILLPGHEARLREAPFTRLEPLVDALVTGLRTHMDLPFAMFGHSLGALVAFHVACRLRDEGAAEPAHLFVSGRRAPQLPPRHPPITHLPDPEFVEEVRRRYNGISDEVIRHPDLLALLVPTLKADMAVIETYVHREGIPLECPISVYGGDDDPEATPAELVSWKVQTRGPLSVRMFPGAHFFVQTAQADLLRAVREELALTVADRALGGRS
jgi:medium-chain acyl-[acyl-carrier-protein] hydrolase